MVLWTGVSTLSAVSPVVPLHASMGLEGLLGSFAGILSPDISFPRVDPLEPRRGLDAKCPWSPTRVLFWHHDGLLEGQKAPLGLAGPSLGALHLGKLRTGIFSVHLPFPLRDRCLCRGRHQR